MVKVSVLMSVYNGGKYIQQTIESVLNQTFKNFEFIIINDGSTDNSIQIINSYNDSRIKLIDNKINKGLACSLNIGLKLATGAYIARIDSDDICLPERIEIQVNYLERNKNIAVVGTFADRIDEQTKFISTFKQPFGEIENLYFLITGKSVLGHPFVLYRKNTIIRIGGYNEIIKAEDYDLWLRLYAAGERTENIPIVLNKYRIHSGQITKNNAFNEHLNNHVRIFHAFYIKMTNNVVEFESLENYIKYLVYDKHTEVSVFDLLNIFDNLLYCFHKYYSNNTIIACKKLFYKNILKPLYYKASIKKLIIYFAKSKLSRYYIIEHIKNCISEKYIKCKNVLISSFSLHKQIKKS